MTAQKFLPAFTFDELKAAARRHWRRADSRTAAMARGSATRPIWTANWRRSGLRSSTPNFEPMITAKSPQGKLDILQASANNFYHNVSLADLANFHETHPLNSRLVKTDSGKLVEEV